MSIHSAFTTEQYQRGAESCWSFSWWRAQLELRVHFALSQFVQSMTELHLLGEQLKSFPFRTTLEVREAEPSGSL